MANPPLTWEAHSNGSADAIGWQRDRLLFNNATLFGERGTAVRGTSVASDARGGAE